MAKVKADFLTKLKKLEEEKQQLINKRKEEIFALIDKAEYLAVDDKLLLGSLLLIKELVEKDTSKLSANDNEMLERLRAKSAKYFRRK